MRHRVALWGLLFGATQFAASNANAWEISGYLAQPVRAPYETFELSDALSYTQGFGMMAPGRVLSEVAGPGLGVDVQADVRLRPALSLGAEGQYQEFKYQTQKSRGLAANVGVTIHFRPQLRGDPWMRFATGYRFLWELDANGQRGTNVLRRGLQLLTVRVGYDLRLYDELAIAPFAGADVDLFVWEDPPTTGANTAMSSAQIGAFIHVGVLGRFDLMAEKAH